LFQIENVYRVGLVEKMNERCAKASCDFVAGAVIEGRKCLVGIECKARLAPGTLQHERDHAEFLCRFEGVNLSTSSATSTRTPTATVTASTRRTSTGTGREIYTLIEVASRDFHTYIGSSHEAVQLLHQAYVYSFQYVLLLVGDASGDIIRGECTK
jgi:hypothetical protein